MIGPFGGDVEYMIIDCHFHIDETMLSLEKMIEGMDENQIAKTVLIASMNETMFEAGDHPSN